MVHGTAVVWLPVSDVRRSLSFYRDTLGLDELHSAEDWAELDANGLHIGLNAHESPGADGGAVIAFQSQDGLDEAVEQLRGEGVQIAGKSASTPGVASRRSKTPTATISSSTSRPLDNCLTGNPPQIRTRVVTRRPGSTNPGFHRPTLINA
jgi:predicted enzyme related to lactoylglutathione lyase